MFKGSYLFQNIILDIHVSFREGITLELWSVDLLIFLQRPSIPLPLRALVKCVGQQDQEDQREEEHSKDLMMPDAPRFFFNARGRSM